ncbi:MAG: penicillin-binding transpeptidase domain-containing protein [Myxococcota bacterium]
MRASAVEGPANTDASPQSEAATDDPAAATPRSAWEDAVARQAEELQARFEQAVVRIVVLDAAGSIVAQHGPIETPHPTASTIKSFTVAAALAEGVGADDPLDLTEGEGVQVGSRRVRDYKGHGTVTVNAALARSSNVAMVRLAERTGERPLYDRVGKVVPLPAREDLDDATALGHLFGSGLTLSTLDLARGYATLAAGGRNPATGAQLVPEAAARGVLDMLRYAVEAAEGTGNAAASPGWQVAGKTGTAQNDTHNTALFFGIAERNGTTHIIGVVVSGVPHDQTGGSLAAAAVADLLARVPETAAPGAA